MIFQHTIDKVLSGEKTQTRRIVKPGQYWNAVTGSVVQHYDYRNDVPVYSEERTYAIQPGRGQKAVGRIEITGIRREDVRNISYEDARAEGFDTDFHFLRTWAKMHDKTAYTAYIAADFSDGDESSMVGHVGGWMSWLKGTRPAERYQAWVLEFRLVEGA